MGARRQCADRLRLHNLESRQAAEVLKRALVHRPTAIMLSFGDPRPFAPTIHQAGAHLIC